MSLVPNLLRLTASAITAVIVLAGCEAISEVSTGPTRFCDYPLEDNGWSPVDEPPEGLQDDANRSLDWFTNEEGAWLGCTQYWLRDACGPSRHFYTRNAAGLLEQQVWQLCMT